MRVDRLEILEPSVDGVVEDDGRKTRSLWYTNIRPEVVAEDLRILIQHPLLHDSEEPVLHLGL